MIAQAYDFDKTGLKLLLDYLTSRNQQIQVNSTYKGVPRGFVLGLLLYNEFITDPLRFIEKSGICDFASDNTLFNCGQDISDITMNLKHDMEIILKCFEINSSEADPND